MKINIDENKKYKEIEINIKCPSINEEVKNIISSINLNNQTLVGKDKDRNYSINIKDIYYFESIDDKTFIYMDKDIYESSLRLYEIEDLTKDASFVRISKSIILNLEKLMSVKALINSRFEGTLFNEEKVIVSRHYIKEFKRKFGL